MLIQRALLWQRSWLSLVCFTYCPQGKAGGDGGFYFAVAGIYLD